MTQAKYDPHTAGEVALEPQRPETGSRNQNDILQRAGTLFWVNQVVLKTREWMHLGFYVSKGHDGTWTDKTSNFILESDKYNTFNGNSSGKIDKLFFWEMFPPQLAPSWWKHLKCLWFPPTLSRDKRNHEIWELEWKWSLFCRWRITTWESLINHTQICSPGTDRSIIIGSQALNYINNKNTEWGEGGGAG